MRRSRLFLATTAIAAVAFTLTACSPNSVTEDQQRGIPSEVATVLPMPSPSTPGGYLGENGPLAARLPDNRIGVVTWGSSSCPPNASAIKTLENNLVELTFAPSENEICTSDLGPTSHIIKLPDEAPKTEFTLRIRYRDSAETRDVKIS